MSSNYVVPEIEDEVTCWLLAQHPEPSIRAYAVASVHADESIIELLLEDETLLVIQAAIFNPRLPHTPNAAAAVSRNDALIRTAITGLNPPSRETVLWLYQHGGQLTKTACVSIISEDRGLIMTALREQVLRETDTRRILGSGQIRPEDHEELVQINIISARLWVTATTNNEVLLKQLAEDADTRVANSAMQRLERLTQKTLLF